MAAVEQPRRNDFARELTTSGISVGLATALTNPLDVVKVRQQMRGTRVENGLKAPGVLRTLMDIVKKEGPMVLNSGMSASVTRGLFYGGLRLGMYNPIKSAIGAGGADASLASKIVAGCTSGMVAAAISNPTDLIKTRLQSKKGKGKTVIEVMKTVVREEGAIGLWHGVMPSMARAAVLTAAQCASYDEIKRGLMRFGGLQDNFTTHLTSSMITGLVSTTVTTPIDVVKTQIMVRGGQFRMEYLYAEGASGLMKGWGASYMRLGPQTTIIFLSLEVLRKHMGLGSL